MRHVPDDLVIKICGGSAGRTHHQHKTLETPDTLLEQHTEALLLQMVRLALER